MNKKASGNQKKNNLYTKIEPTNICCSSNERKKVVGHFPKGKTGRIWKTIYFLLNANYNKICNVEVADVRAVNLANGKSVKIPCTLLFAGQSVYIDILSKEICKHVYYIWYYFKRNLSLLPPLNPFK